MLFPDSGLVIRAVDDTWYYIYSSEESNALLLSKLFPTKSRKTRAEDFKPFVLSGDETRG
jgi:hypothetical protein